MTSTHMVHPDRTRRVRRSVYDSYIPPGRSAPSEAPTRTGGSATPTEATRPVEATTAPGAATTTGSAEWATTEPARIDGTVAVWHPVVTTSASGPLVDLATLAPSNAVPFSPSPRMRESGPTQAPRERAAAKPGGEAEQVRAEALEWLRDLAGTPPLPDGID